MSNSVKNEIWQTTGPQKEEVRDQDGNLICKARTEKARMIASTPRLIRALGNLIGAAEQHSMSSDPDIVIELEEATQAYEQATQCKPDGNFGASSKQTQIENKVLSDVVEMLSKQHDWLTRTATINLVAGLYGRSDAVLKVSGRKQN